MGECTAHVRFRGESGHDYLRRTCLLMTQSGLGPLHGKCLLSVLNLSY
jgi:hypothetical protein